MDDQRFAGVLARWVLDPARQRLVAPSGREYWLPSARAVALRMVAHVVRALEAREPHVATLARAESIEAFFRRTLAWALEGWSEEEQAACLAHVLAIQAFGLTWADVPSGVGHA